ncbi:hypothetical protein VULLAG_LOCUS21222 [Vulpes lagopus]
MKYSVFLGGHPLPTCMWASLTATVTPARESAVCLGRESLRDCGNQTSCAEEPHPPGCPEGGLCPGSPPAPCPPGTFLSGAGPHDTPLCHPCPRGFFNHWPGQDACFPCGSEATQPEDGKDTCVCLRPGRVFQPSDGQCPCLPGYQDVGEPRGCVQREHESCKDGATWNQEGLCLTKDQWSNHCAQEVCATPGDAHGYDPGLGLCLCWGQHSSGMCGLLCPEGQRHILQLSCSEGIPQISITEGTGSQGGHDTGTPHSQELYLLDRPSSPRAVGHPCNLDQRQKPVPLYVVRMDGIGFLGLIRPGHELLHSLGLFLRDPGPPGHDAGKSSGGYRSSSWSASLNTSHGDLLPPEPGIRNPTVCLQINDTLAFLVTREHYPEYDLGHFYNTLGKFDWGRFRAIPEEFRLHNQEPYLFLQQFQQPGVYVFRLSSNRHRKMYIRTLPPGGQCFREGPFASTTPRYLIQTGIAKIPRPLKRSDWPQVLGETVLLLGFGLLLLIQCHSLSWARKATPNPTFRTHQQGYNLDAYTSQRAGLTSVRRGRQHQDSDTPTVEGDHGGPWEAQEQVDLEWFDPERFFSILLRQSLSVTTKISQMKEEALGAKNTLEVQVWNRGLGRGPAVPGGGTPSTNGQQRLACPECSGAPGAAEAAARAAEEEAGRRGRLAAQYAASLSRQLRLLRQDLGARREQWASFCSALLVARRLLKAQAGSRPATSSQAGPSPGGGIPQLDATLGRLSQAVLQEGHRLRAWGALGTATGAELLRPAGPQEGTQDISVNPVTKLMVPGPNCVMLPASGHAGSIPPGYFIHPDTGKVLPEAGNLGYDLQGANLVPTTDFSSGSIRTSEAAILPYVPYPTCPATGCPPATRLPILQPRRTSQLGALMTDPATGIESQVLALGGLRDALGNLMLPGDSFEEPLSQKTVRLHGASQQEGRTVPHMGGSQALLDANVLLAQKRVITMLQNCQERPGSRTQGLLEVAIKDMRQALALSLHHVLQQSRRLERQLGTAEGIAASGGRIGMMCYPGTELWVPVLYGMEIPDPEGSGLMVPILGMETDGDSGDATPLAGSMEDADGKGLVPISIGAQAIDPLTGEPGPVIGARTDPCVGVVVPIVQVLEALPRGVRNPDLLDTLEQERRAREQYWYHQEQEEGRLAEQLGHLSWELLSIPGRDARQQLRAAEEARAALESCCLRESQRRARALSMQSSPERGLLSQADREEWEQEAQMMLAMQNVLESIGQTVEKLRQAVGWLRGQEEEMWLQKSRSQSPQIWNRSRKDHLEHLTDEFQEVVRKRQSFLDQALGHLQYQRELSRLHLLHTQIVASGSPECLENYPGDRFYGMITTSLRDPAAACPLLIPFLKSLTTVLMGAQGHGPGLEAQGQGTDTDKVDTMWTSLLFATLRKVDIWSQAHKKEAELQGQVHHQLAPKSSLQEDPKPQIIQKEELITVQPTDLSAREFVVYQYGLSILHLLTPELHAPEITLQVASCLPAMEASDNAFQGSFFYQRAENTLFVGRESLASVGSFVLLLIHCLAHVATKDFHQDSNPAFLRSFYKKNSERSGLPTRMASLLSVVTSLTLHEPHQNVALQAYIREAFATTLRMSAISWDGKLDQSISAALLGEQPISEGGRDLLSKLLERKCESHLEPESSEEYIKRNMDLLLFTNMEHFLKTLLTAEQQIQKKPRDKHEDQEKSGDLTCQDQDQKLATWRNN